MSLSVAVHLHLYYVDMWESIKTYLENIADYPYDLYVTLNQDNPELIQKIKAYHPNTDIIIVENKGYDVGPFIHFLNRTDLNQYDLILKIHTKNTKNGPLTLLNNRYINRKNWFHLLVGGLIGSRELFQKNMEQFQKSDKLGMIGSKYLITAEPTVSKNVRHLVNDIMQKIGYSNPVRVNFVAGTMFMVRSHLLQEIKDNFKITDFENTNPDIKDGTVLHALERVFGCLVEEKGYFIEGFDKSWLIELRLAFDSLRHFVYHRKITKTNHLLVKVCKIPVYRRRLRQSDAL